MQPAAQGLSSTDAPRTRKRFDPRRFYAPAIGIPLLYVLIRYLPTEALFAVILGTAWLTLAEYYRLHFSRPRLTGELVAGLVGTAALLSALKWPGLVSERAVVTAMLATAFTYGLLRRQGLSQWVADTAVLGFGVLYVGLALGHLLLIRDLQGGVFLLFFVVAVTWAGDTGAYFVGRTLGKRKLAPLISPNKTVEGLLGGAGLAVAVALLARFWFLPSFSILDGVLLGLLLTAAGTAGDLTESALKRSAGVKDSGTLIPGHGGLLDRLDSLLFTAPVFYYYVVLVKA